MFQKIKFKFDDSIIKKCLLITQNIDTFDVLEHDKLEDFVIFNYEEGSEEKYFCEKFEKQNKQKANGKSLSYDHKIIDFPYKKLIDYLPNSLTSLEKPVLRWQVFGPNSSIPAHIDSDRKCSINLYLSVNNEKTVFYNKKRSGIRFILENGCIVNESFLDEWVEETVFFIANKYDLYLLNSSQPHSVLNTSDTSRISLQFSFKQLNYERVNELLCLENWI